MSDLNERNIPFAGDADDIEAQAADWLQRQQFWDWSDERQAEFEIWLAKSSAHRVAYLRMKSGYGRTDRLVALRASSGEVARRIWPILFRVAASVALIASLGVAGAFYFAQEARAPEASYSTPIGGHEIIRLADGSEIELNTDTAVGIGMESGRRVVKLEKGEAYFKVAHDPNHPFVVQVASHRVTDLGTEFSVHNSGTGIEVALVKGRARIDSVSDRDQSATLVPGDVAVATVDTMSIRKENTADIENALEWRRGLLVFHNTTLADAASALNRYNSNKLIIEDPEAAKLTINGTFGTHDVEFFARMTQSVFGLHVTNAGTTMRISR